MLITFDGSNDISKYVSPLISHLQFSHPSVTDQLLLAEHDDKPYENYRTGQTQSDGRSILGALRLKGGNWKKQIWECNFLAIGAQVVVFEQLVQAQQDDLLTVTAIDRWVDGFVFSKSVWIQIDRQYLSIVGGNWFRLQFQLLEV